MNHDKNESVQGGMQGVFRRRKGNNRNPLPGRKSKWIFVAVDVVLLLTIIAAILAIVSLLTPFSLFGHADGEVRPVVWVVEINDVDDAFVESLEVGDTVTDFETGTVVGVIRSLEVFPYEVYLDFPSKKQDPDLRIPTASKITYDTKTVWVTLTVNANYQEGFGYTVEGRKIAAGRDYRLAFGGRVGDAVCIDIPSIYQTETEAAS